jgi:glycosyltransferase involved in cell wall biosynthesis
MASVLMVTTSPERRGAEVFASGLARGLRARGHRCDLAAVRPTDRADPLPVPVVGRSRWDPVGLARLARLARTHDLVVGHGSITLLAGAAVSAAAGRPFVYRSIGDPSVWGRVPLAPARIGAPLGRAAAVVALYDGARAELIGRYGLRPERVVVIPNAVDARRFAPADATDRLRARDRLGLDDDRSWVGFLGALSTEKRPGLALAAVAGTEDLGLVVAGDGPDAARVRAEAARIAPDRIRVVGALEDPRILLAAVDALVVPSRTEGMPAAAIEASMMEVPVVATDVGGMSAVVVDGVTGRLLPADPTAGAVGRALAEAAAARGTLGPAARAHCLDRYGLEGVVDAWSDLIDRVVTGRRPAGHGATRGT